MKRKVTEKNQTVSPSMAALFAVLAMFYSSSELIHHLIAKADTISFDFSAGSFTPFNLLCIALISAFIVFIIETYELISSK